jgi:hypothetical protein
MERSTDSWEALLMLVWHKDCSEKVTSPDKYADLISKNVVAYINVDVGVGGHEFRASATHSLDG